MEMPSTLKKEHPSYGCEQAWFLFGMAHDQLVVVEAPNGWAVQTIERIVSIDGRASASCELLAVYREVGNVGLRADRINEIPYIDFIIDVVEASRVTSDHWTSSAFQKSLTMEMREKALKRTRFAPGVEAKPAKVFTLTVKKKDSGPKLSVVRDNREDVVAALTDLGYKKAQAQKAVAAIGDEIDKMPLEDAIKKALRNS